MSSIVLACGCNPPSSRLGEGRKRGDRSAIPIARPSMGWSASRFDRSQRMTIGSPLLSFVAGVLSIFSPCVLPILPIVLGAASSAGRLGPVALAAGLALSFTAIGLFVATIGYSIGLDAGVFSLVGAILIIAIGIVLVVPRLQAQLAAAGGPIANWTDRRFGEKRGGSFGQFGIGVLLGAV